jgi:hypothetical protein
MLFEILFPLAFIDATLLQIALCAAATFHLANACLFGMNRFLWIGWPPIHRCSGCKNDSSRAADSYC